jgi:uncharacterized membrane protein
VMRHWHRRPGGFKYALLLRVFATVKAIRVDKRRMAGIVALSLIGLMSLCLATSGAIAPSVLVAQGEEPVADAGDDITIVASETAVFDGTRSTDDVQIVNYTWNFTYDDEMQYLWGPSPEFEFWTVGEYMVTLTVTDGDNHTSSDTVTVLVEKNFLMKYWPFLILGAAILIAGAHVLLSSRKKKAFVSPRNVARYGVLTALVAAVTIVTFVPFAPTKGYFNAGDSMVFFSALTFTWRMGGICGGFGSAAADILLGSGFFAPITLVAKGSEGAVCGLLCRIKGGHKYAIVLGVVVGGTCMVMTYFLGELLLLNVGLGAALTEAVGNTFQVVIGGTIGVLLSHSVKRAYPAVANE